MRSLPAFPAIVAASAVWLAPVPVLAQGRGGEGDAGRPTRVRTVSAIDEMAQPAIRPPL